MRCYVVSFLLLSRETNIPLLLVGLSELDLYAVDTVDAVDEEDQDEDEGDFHSILQLGYKWALTSAGMMSYNLIYWDGLHT